MASPKQIIVTNDEKKVAVSSDSKKGSSDTPGSHPPGDPGPSPPYPGMSSIGDEDEQLLARIGYRQVCWLKLESGQRYWFGRNFVENSQNGPQYHMRFPFLEF
jgi:hypothetical protein